MALLRGIPRDSIRQLVQVRLAKMNSPIIGELTILDGAVRFQPAIAFTRGLRYEVRSSDKLLSEFEIPKNDKNDAPIVIAIYPTAGVLPENLLKMYIAFSKPMQEGQALNNIFVLKDRNDTIPVFLDLDQELWNKERTMLTLWLDPGRIKRDLQPNLKMGTPLQKGSSYQLLLNNDWRDADGDSLSDDYKKEFLVGPRDSLSPDPRLWTIYETKSGSTQPLKIDLHESLDYMLLKNAIRIIDSKGSNVMGTFAPEERETILSFIPSAAWNKGEYTIEIESRLEDLAGNNLSRLFDQDLTTKNPRSHQDLYKRSFRIQ
ncbi:MAG: Ig-like domain-containing protein [Chitinophagales bacterium]